MSRTKPFIFGLMLGAGLSFVALRYHVVRYNEGFMLVPRTEQPPVRSAYADIRDWGTAMWKQYPEVAAALVADGHSKLVADSLTDDLLGHFDAETDAEPLDLLPEDSAASPTRPASSTRNSPPSPIRLTPTGSERRIAPERPARLSQPTGAAAPRVSVEARKPASDDESTDRVRSALESLFAPYGESASAPQSGSSSSSSSTVKLKSSVPAESATAPKRILDLQELEIDLGPARQVIPSTSIPQQAASVGIFSPRRVPKAAEVAVSPAEAAPPTAVSTAPTHQFPLK